MRGHFRLLLILALLIGCGAAVFLGDVQPNADLSSVLELWGDVLRDADQAGLKLTRVSDAEEMQLGNRLASGVLQSWSRRPEWEPYVGAVAGLLTPRVERQGIRYRFYVVDDPDVNAFALPGGQIFVTTGLLRFVQSEAELAAVLGHEISHVDLRHCIEHYQYELRARKLHAAPIGQIAGLARALAAMEYNKYQELDADANGLKMSIAAGYDPRPAGALFQRMAQLAGERPAAESRTPTGELVRVAGGAISGYFRSHPYSGERQNRLNAMIARNRSELHGRTVYTGGENLRRRIPMTQQRFPAESRTF